MQLIHNLPRKIFNHVNNLFFSKLRQNDFSILSITLPKSSTIIITKQCKHLIMNNHFLFWPLSIYLSCTYYPYMYVYVYLHFFISTNLIIFLYRNGCIVIVFSKIYCYTSLLTIFIYSVFLFHHKKHLQDDFYIFLKYIQHVWILLYFMSPDMLPIHIFPMSQPWVQLFLQGH